METYFYLRKKDTECISQEFHLYDGSGNRVLKRSISGGSTKLTVYAFGLQELSYTGSGAYSSQPDYYAIAGHLLGSTNGTATTYDLTDAEGSVLTSLSSSAVLGEQIYGPYGNQRYTQGTMGTDKGYTGQFQDAVSGFDYYNARYYDPVMGQFLSADSVQGNAQGRDPYAYVAGNPETATDPTGQRISCPPDCGTTSSGIPCAYGGSTCGPQHGGGDCNDACGGGGGTHPTPPSKPKPPTKKPTDGSGSSGNGGSGHCGCDIVTIPQQPKCPSGFTGPGCTGTSGDCNHLTSPQCITKGETRAYNEAYTASTVFNILAAVFTLLGVAVGILAGTNWWSAPILWGIVAALGALAFQAVLIGQLFGGEGHSTGDSTATNLAWFTKANIEAQRTNINAIALGGPSFISAGGIKLLQRLGVDAALQSAEKAAGLNQFGISFGVTELLGGLALSSVGFYYTNVQEEEGIQMIIGGAHELKKTINWSQARFFARYKLTNLFPGQETMYYELSSSTEVIMWIVVSASKRPFSIWMPLLPIDDYQRQMQALCDFIVAKTGLELYDLSQQ